MWTEAIGNSFPPKLTTKYTVSKVLRMGACGGGEAGLQGATLAHGCHQDHLQAHNRHHLQLQRQLLQRGEQGMDPSISEPPAHHIPGGCDLNAQFPVHCARSCLTKIIKKTKLNKGKTKLQFFQIKYLHFKKICHRDLNPEKKQLCLSDKSLPIVKIMDMGLSKLVDKTRLGQRSTAMPLRGFAPLSAQTQISCLTYPQWQMGFFNVSPSTPDMCSVWGVFF